MLILSRKKNESVMIDEDVQVVVLGMNGENIILGFDAPQTVSIHRFEVYLRNKIFDFKKKKNIKSSYLSKDTKINNLGKNVR